MASGVGVTEECKFAFNDLLKDRKYSAVVLKISDDLTNVVVDYTQPPQEGGDAESTYKEFLNTLPESDCRFVIYDFEYVSQDVKKNRVVMILWSPESSKVKAKMMYASSKQALLNSLVGIQTQVQGTDFDEISYKTIAENIIGSGVRY
mmetsp:Transcript_307/g.1000  ORF Transcript_307/g.1000 Transcript_307/m.1000 type:complete len:148 (+) Transcript_307:118-561(+)|eukprot:CAMPEP_0198724486 /NCGR_PEP_ID=MMETSP1475-20131203/1940_1 /TAXON_ID= ORGANISM="Unidentified sp., Strain CCMP1999" /NCGR_SAMPLE_ID=MMETSP1475 /ASSEMBLY_ACC=CAM_ASM_001111 /LENGTH=147 /DNA_ID=CAMNT_0044486023 /DNA_START=105 /DNA_END=548 /DNA_ORIENTATION=+